MGGGGQEALKDRAQLVFKNAALRQQLAAYKRSVKRPKIRDGNAPIPRAVEHEGEVVATPVLGGLHHLYSRAA